MDLLIYVFILMNKFDRSRIDVDYYFKINFDSGEVFQRFYEDVAGVLRDGGIGLSGDVCFLASIVLRFIVKQ